VSPTRIPTRIASKSSDGSNDVQKKFAQSKRNTPSLGECFFEPQTGGGSKDMSNRPEIEIQHQTAFGDDGRLEVVEENVENSLEDFGAEVDHRERDSRLDRPEAD